MKSPDVPELSLEDAAVTSYLRHVQLAGLQKLLRVVTDAKMAVEQQIQEQHPAPLIVDEFPSLAEASATPKRTRSPKEPSPTSLPEVVTPEEEDALRATSLEVIFGDKFRRFPSERNPKESTQ